MAKNNKEKVKKTSQKKIYNEKKHLKLSLDVGSLFTKYIVVSVHNGKETYQSANILSTPPNLFDTEGKVRNTDSLEEFLNKIMEHIKTLDNKNKSLDILVYLSLSYVENLTTHFTSQYYELKDYDKELENTIHESDKYDTSKYVFNYAYNNGIETPLAVCDTLTVGYDSSIIDFYLKFFDKNHILVKSISLGNLAVINKLPNSEEAYEAEYSLYVDLGATTTEVILLKNDFPFNYFIVNKGGNDLTKALMERLGKSFKESEEFKITSNELDTIYQEDGVPLPDNEEVVEVMELLDPIFNEWLNEIYQDIDTELKLNHVPSIKSVFVTGGSGYIKNLPESIAHLFNAPLKEYDYNEIFNMKKIKDEINIVYHNMNSFLPSLSHLTSKPINLINRDYIKSKETKLPNMRYAGAVFVTSMALFLGLNGFGYLETQSNNVDIKTLNQELTVAERQYDAQMAEIEEYENMDKQISAYESKLVGALQWSKIMAKTYEATPEGIQILEVYEIGDEQIEIVGLSVNYELIGLFGKYLKKNSNAVLIDSTPVNVVSKQVEVGEDEFYEMKKFTIRGVIHPNNLISGKPVETSEEEKTDTNGEGK